VAASQPLLERARVAERWRQQTIRRRPYEFFIHNTFAE
jgi:hypothetical protein